jgi:cyclase
MMQRRFTAAVAVLTLLAVAGEQPAQSATALRFEELAPGIFAALQPDQARFDDSNSLVLIGAQEVVVVDAQADPDGVRQLISWIGEQTAAPVTMVINTHWHGDHTQGNAIYRDAYGEDVEIVGHRSLTEDVPARASEFVDERIAYFDAELPAARERLARGVFRDGSPMSETEQAEQAAVIERAQAWLEANRGARFLPPSRTFGMRQRLRRAGHAIELIHFRAHTRGDTVVWLPDTGIIATGDVLDDLPYVGHGYPLSWRAALQTLREMPITTIVPGHGPVFTGFGQLENVAGFLDAVIETADAAVAAGTSLETTIERADLTAWQNRLARDAAGAEFFDQVLGEAIERAWREARGELDDDE